MARTTFRIPFLHDHHTHPLLYAAFQDALDLSAGPAASATDEAVRRIRERAAGAAGWTIAFGWHSGRFPLAKAAFDDLGPVVVLNLSLHGLIVNDAGRDVIGRSDPEAAERLDDQDWVERNLRRVLNLFVTAGAPAARLRRFYDTLRAEHGVFHAEEMLLVDAAEVRRFEEAGLLSRTRFWASPEQFDALPADVRAKVHGVKLFTDGAIGSWSAALHRPFNGTGNAGMLLYEDAALRALLSRSAGERTPLAVHAIGDRAIDQVVTAADAVGGRAAGLELRIEHAQFLSEATARRAKSLGIALCMQPNFSDDSVHYAARLPSGYPQRNNPFRMLIDRVGYVPGEDLLFGSDGMPHGAGEALRQSLFPPHAGQTLTLSEFVAGYCIADTDRGHIDVRVDPAARSVECSVTSTAADAPSPSPPR